MHPDHLQTNDPTRIITQDDAFEVLNRIVRLPSLEQILTVVPQPVSHGQQDLLVTAQAGRRSGLGTRIRLPRNPHRLPVAVQTPSR